MRMLVFILVMISLLTAARADDAVAIKKLIADIDTAAKVDKKHVLKVLIINTNVAGTTLEAQKSRTGFSLGEVYVAHSIALASRKTFNQVVAMKGRGNSWAKVAQMNNVRLRGVAALMKEIAERERNG